MSPPLCRPSVHPTEDKGLDSDKSIEQKLHIRHLCGVDFRWNSIVQCGIQHNSCIFVPVAQHTRTILLDP